MVWKTIWIRLGEKVIKYRLSDCWSLFLFILCGEDINDFVVCGQDSLLVFIYDIFIIYLGIYRF